MLDPTREEQMEAALQTTESSRSIARRLGISRGTVCGARSGQRPLDLSRRRQEINGLPPRRIKCAVCGAEVERPCRACQVRRLMAAGLVAPPPPDRRDGGPPLTMALLEEDEKRYLALRAQQSELLGDLLDQAEREAAEDPRDDDAPTIQQLREIEAERAGDD